MTDEDDFNELMRLAAELPDNDRPDTPEERLEQSIITEAMMPLQIEARLNQD